MPAALSECFEAFIVRQDRPALNDFKLAHVRLAESPIHGTGMFAASRLRPDYLVGDYEGERVSRFVVEQCEQMYKEQGLDCYFMAV